MRRFRRAAALLADGRLVDLSAELVPKGKAEHARIEVLDRDPEGRIYYRYWGRIRISAHMMDRGQGVER